MEEKEKEVIKAKAGGGSRGPYRCFSVCYSTREAPPPTVPSHLKKRHMVQMQASQSVSRTRTQSHHYLAPPH